MAVFYVDKKFPTSEGYVPIEYVIIFLLLHVLDPLVRPSPSPTSQYETMWPSSMDMDQISPSPPSPRSPTGSSKRLHLNNSPPSSPPAISPRSAKNLASGPKYSKSSSQHMQTLKRKLPLILTSLACDMNALDELRSYRDDLTADMQCFSGISNQTMSTAMLSGRSFDCLRLILGGGNSFELETLKLSLLYPALSSFDDKLIPEVLLPCIDIATWLENFLTCNEVFYPSGVFNISSPNLSAKETSNKIFFPLPSTTDQAIGSIVSPKVIDDYSQSGSYPRYIAGQSMVQQPQRVINPISSLSKSNATLIHGCNSSTYIHVISDENPPASSPTFSQLQSYSDDRHDLAALLEKQDLADKPSSSSMNGSDIAMSEGELTDVSDKDLVVKIPRYVEPFTSPDLAEKIDRLPSLSVGNCVKSTIYLISPYASGNISSCRDCDIIVGPVSGVLVLIGCEKVRLSVACRKLVLFNCVECDIHVANLSPTVIFGDSRSLSFGKL